MSLPYTASLKEFGSLVCLWHDVKLRKTQLEVRSLNVTFGDLWGHRVVVFLMCQIVGWTAMPSRFSLSAKNLRGGGRITAPPPGRAQVSLHLWMTYGGMRLLFRRPFHREVEEPGELRARRARRVASQESQESRADIVKTRWEPVRRWTSCKVGSSRNVVKGAKSFDKGEMSVLGGTKFPKKYFYLFIL